jgi:histidine ammonia-lyase
MNIKNEFLINPGKLGLSELRDIFFEKYNFFLLPKYSIEIMSNSVKSVNKLICNKDFKAVYGVNTGFGKLANTKIDLEDLSILQRNLILSHSAGVGEFLDNKIVTLISILKISSLARGYSGVRYELLEALLKLINNQYFPCIPIKGSVGASGDLAPLAHLVCPLIGEGLVQKNGKKIPALQALQECNIKKFELLPLEGLSLLNGTQVSTALALAGLFKIQDVFSSTMISGAMTLTALNGRVDAFDSRIHELRGHKGQMWVAQKMRELLNQNESIENTKAMRVQDPYSLRCQPQVLGACLDNINFVSNTLGIEANAVTNNPISLFETDEFISGGNFHAEPVAFASDILAFICTEISSISERRIALMLDSNFTGLPDFLVYNSGLNSGFMIAQVTAAALVSENKSRSFPCSVDSIPTSANQEDHVSMATHAAYRLNELADNSSYVIAIELLAACQAYDLNKNKKFPEKLKNIYTEIRNFVPFYEKDRYFSSDIEIIKKNFLHNKFNFFN